jgi:hypothetical protein
MTHTDETDQTVAPVDGEAGLRIAREGWQALREALAGHPAGLVLLDTHQPELDEHGQVVCAGCWMQQTGLATVRWECELYRSVVQAMRSVAAFTESMRQLVRGQGEDAGTLEAVREGILRLAGRPPDICSTLAASVLPGDGVMAAPERRRGRGGPVPLTLTGPVPPGKDLSIDEGTDHWEQHLIARCTGTGPYIVELGTDEAPTRLKFAHLAGAVVMVRGE